LCINLEELKEANKLVDVVCITEHFIMEGCECNVVLENYTLASSYCRRGTKRGGACILLKQEHRFRELSEVKKYCLDYVFECCAVELPVFKTAILCIYRVPKQDNLCMFFERLEKLLFYVAKLSFNNVIIAGDFNIDILKNSNMTLDFKCLLLRYNFKLSLNIPTRLASQSCIDNFAHNLKKICKAEVLELGLSDHTAQLIKVPVKKTPKINVWRKLKRDYSSENIEKFKMCIKTLSFSDIYLTNDPNIAYSRFMDDFKLFYILCFPQIHYLIKFNSTPRWVSRGVRICSRKKKALLWQYRLNPTNENKSKYINYCKLFKRIIILTKRAQHTYRIKTSNNKCKTAWQIIKKSRNSYLKESIYNIKTTEKGYINNPIDIANAFNEYFIEKVYPIPGAGKNNSMLINSQVNSMFLAPSSPIDIHKIIKDLKNTKSVGHDGISTDIIKAVNEYISHHLSHIVNLSISTGIFPDDLKQTIIKPLFKKNNRQLMDGVLF
jgi:hypothetical protein